MSDRNILVSAVAAVSGFFLFVFTHIPTPKNGILVHPEKESIAEVTSEPTATSPPKKPKKRKKEISVEVSPPAPPSDRLTEIKKGILPSASSPRPTDLERTSPPTPSPDDIVEPNSYIQPRIIKRVPVALTMDEGATTEKVEWNFDGKVTIGDNQLPGKNIIYHYLGDEYDIKVYWIKLSKDVFTEFDELAQAFTENSIRKHFGKYSGEQTERGEVTEMTSKTFPQEEPNGLIKPDGYVDFKATINNSGVQGGCQGRAAYRPGEFFMIYGINNSGTKANDRRIAKIIQSSHWRE